MPRSYFDAYDELGEPRSIIRQPSENPRKLTLANGRPAETVMDRIRREHAAGLDELDRIDCERSAGRGPLAWQED